VGQKISIIGGGLAGVEAAYQASKRGLEVDLYEMRPEVNTEAHDTGFFGEMVCSNSLGSSEITSASGLLKAELKLLDSFFLAAAEENRVPAGSSLSVDRFRLAEDLTNRIEALPGVNVYRREVKELAEIKGPMIIATGPLTSDDFARSLTQLTMRKHLFFYDATSPIIRADSIDLSKVFRASRYEKGTADFLNIPLSEGQYNEFVSDLVQAEKVDLRDFEKNLFFESCLPIEEIAGRGPKALSFGTLKPVGLKNPENGEMPYAVVQLRQDDVKEDFYQFVGFQTRLKQGEQKRILRKLPGLENARFERYGRMHRNTYINAPLIVNRFFQVKNRQKVFLAGQISGVEGYVESICSGLLCGIFAAMTARKLPLIEAPADTACGSLVHYICSANWKDFKPTKFTFGLLPDLKKTEDSFKKGHRWNMTKKQKKEMKAKYALESISRWKAQIDI
jgi:methylenetetrahydrofolate--tRNA-(uracil-5-)-methyltransferase